MSEEKPRVPSGVHGVHNPCYRCPNREMGCHGKCGAYKAYRAARDKQLAQEHVIRDNDMEYDLYRRGRYPRLSKRSNRP